MKFLALFLKTFAIQFLWGTLLGIAIVIINLNSGNKDIVHISNSLFIWAGAFLFLGPLFFRPKGLGFAPTRESPIYVQVEPSEDESLVGLPEEEQKRYLLLDRFLILAKVFGIGSTLVFYSIFIYIILGR